jgi:hypothetical protein
MTFASRIYVDQERTCIQCRQPFTFRATEQKLWYESLAFYGTSIAIWCPACRRKRRTDSALQMQISAANSEVRASPKDPTAWLNLAEGIVRYHQPTDAAI